MKIIESKNLEIFTIGHSNWPMVDFLALLKEFDIRSVVDVRRFPSSRKFPHFNRGPFQVELDRNGIGYLWVEALGGHRHSATKEASPNQGLQNIAFRNYADHMLTGEFRLGVENLMQIARSQRTTVMCAERFFWKCHRRLLSDYLHAQGILVQHILEFGKLQQHRLTPEALIEGDHVLYPLPLLAGSKT